MSEDYIDYIMEDVAGYRLGLRTVDNRFAELVVLDSDDNKLHTMSFTWEQLGPVADMIRDALATTSGNRRLI